MDGDSRRARDHGGKSVHGSRGRRAGGNRQTVTPRKLRASDIPILQSFAQGFEYPDPLDPMIEAIVVVADENDKPVAWFIGKRICEVYGAVDPSLPTPAKMQALRIGHGCLGMLKARGYTHVEAMIC